MREKKTSFRKKETENEFVSSKRNRNSEEDVYIIWTKENTSRICLLAES